MGRSGTLNRSPLYILNVYFTFHFRVAYRDAVVDAGTGPALVTIASWIKSKKVSGMEAAKLLSALPDTVKTPTNDYLDALFVSILDFHCSVWMTKYTKIFYQLLLVCIKITFLIEIASKHTAVDCFLFTLGAKYIVCSYFHCIRFS